jgi:hypothetical protein
MYLSFSSSGRLSRNLPVIGTSPAGGDNSPKKIRKKITPEQRERRKIKSIEWWRDFRKHKKHGGVWPIEIPFKDCECGKSLFDHPSLPNSDIPARGMFCPFLQLRKLGHL